MLHSGHTRRPALATTVSILAVTVALLAGASSVQAQTPNKKALIGSWVETVTFPPETGRPLHKGLSTFHSDGTMICSDQGSVTTTGIPGVFTACHGVWTHLKHRTFAYTSRHLISDLSGNLVGYLKVRGEYTVADSGTEYSGASFAQIVDVDGNVLFDVHVTNAGERIEIELP